MPDGYDFHQRHAERMVCSDCREPFDVTHAETVKQPFCCVWCSGVRLLSRLKREQSILAFTPES